MDVLCADKTGTLTQNKLTLGEPFCLMQSPPMNSSCWLFASQAANNDTIDLAVLGGLKDKQALKSYQIIRFSHLIPCTSGPRPRSRARKERHSR